jgi:hypothetical protein
MALRVQSGLNKGGFAPLAPAFLRQEGYVYSVRDDRDEKTNDRGAAPNKRDDGERIAVSFAHSSACAPICDFSLARPPTIHVHKYLCVCVFVRVCKQT